MICYIALGLDDPVIPTDLGKVYIEMLHAAAEATIARAALCPLAPRADVDDDDRPVLAVDLYRRRLAVVSQLATRSARHLHDAIVPTRRLHPVSYDAAHVELHPASLVRHSALVERRRDRRLAVSTAASAHLRHDEHLLAEAVRPVLVEPQLGRRDVLHLDVMGHLEDEAGRPSPIRAVVHCNNAHVVSRASNDDKC